MRRILGLIVLVLLLLGAGWLVLGGGATPRAVTDVEAGSSRAPVTVVEHPTMNECVRESLLSITLPAPPKGGRDAIWLSVPLGPDAPK